MFNKVKNYLNANKRLKKRNAVLSFEVKQLKTEISALVDEIADKQLEINSFGAADVIKKILGRDISWYDYKEMNDEDRKAYFNMAKDLLKNDVFINESRSYIADLVQEIAHGAKDFNQVENLRMSINGVKTLQERIESIENPFREVSRDNLDDSI